MRNMGSSVDIDPGTCMLCPESGRLFPLAGGTPKALATSHHLRRNSARASSGSCQNFPGLHAAFLLSPRGPLRKVRMS